jgi:ATP synthase F1 gamma subunit
VASLQDIRRRITSVQSTRKITRAMEMVAAAKLRRAQARVEALRPYAIDMVEMMLDLATYADEPGLRHRQGPLREAKGRRGARHAPRRRRRRAPRTGLY